jgi:glycosyltransferase involved in cell wall biosynthesis
MNRGGAELRILELMSLMRDLGVRFDFCTLQGDPGTLDGRIRELGGEVIPCPMGKNRFAFARRFVAFLRSANYDVVHSHVHLTSGWILQMADHCGVPGRVMHFRTTSDGGGRSLVRRMYRGLMRRLAERHANAVLAVSKAAIAYGWGAGWQEDPRVRVIYNGLDVEPFRPAPGVREDLLAELDLGEASRLVLQVGRFVSAKGHRELLPALPGLIERFPVTHVLFAGDGERREEIERGVADLGLREHVHFLGVRSDVPRLLQACDVSILPSIWEGLPGVVLESIAARTPVVAFALPGVIEIARYSNLVELVPPDSPEALVAKVEEVLTRQTGQEVAASFPEEFELERCARSLLSVYEDVVSSG